MFLLDGSTRRHRHESHRPDARVEVRVRVSAGARRQAGAHRGTRRRRGPDAEAHRRAGRRPREGRAGEAPRRARRRRRRDRPADESAPRASATRPPRRARPSRPAPRSSSRPPSSTRPTRTRRPSGSPTSSSGKPTVATGFKTPSSPARSRSPRCSSSPPTTGTCVRLGIPTDDTVELILGDGTTSEHHIDEIAPVYRNRRARLQHLIREHLAESGRRRVGRRALPDRRTLRALRGRGREHRRPAARRRDPHEPARAPRRGRGHDPRSARARRRSARTDAGCPSAATRRCTPRRSCRHEATTGAPIPFALHAPQVIADLPAPDAGDIFFDFEGDPLHYEERSGAPLWGLDYLFGLVDVDETFTPFWAHDLAAEKQALLDFLAFVTERRTRYPGHAHLPLRELRAHPPALDRRPPRRRRARRRRTAARRRARRPLRRRQEGAAGRRALLLDQEARAAVHGR